MTHQPAPKEATAAIDSNVASAPGKATEECSACDAFKKAYLNCKEKDVTIISSPEGFPGRVIASEYVERIGEDSRCITQGLINAALGNMDSGLVFCGSKVYKADKIEKVADIFREFA